MATRLIRHLLSTPQWLPLPGFAGVQVRNAAGGHVFPIDDWARLDRFLILGSERGTYYTSEAALTVDNAAVVGRCLAADAARTLVRIVAVSEQGLAPKQAPTLLALALAAAHDRPEVRALALAALPRVARTGAHLLTMVEALLPLRGTGRALKRALRSWLLDRPVEDLALQAVKYGRRGGVALRDVLRLAHPGPADADHARRAAFEWIVRGTVGEATPALMRAASAARHAPDATALATLVREARLPREAVPTERAADPQVLAALVGTMPPHALLRNLNRLAAHGVVPGDDDATALVLRKLGDVEALRRARLHPFTLWVAARQYALGRGGLGRLTWQPAGEVVDALDAAVTALAAAAVPSGRRLLVAIDVSGSMSVGVAGSALSAKAAAAGFASLLVRMEPRVRVIGFDTAVHQLPLTPRQRIDDAIRLVEAAGGGGTDIALPFAWARQQGIAFDGVVVLTDGETWAGREHVVQALARYRREVGPARVVTAALTATGTTVVPADDPMSLGIAGLDASLPQLVAWFMAQER